MLKSSGFKHGWPKPVDLLFQVLRSRKTLDDDDDTLFSDSSPKSVSSLSCATGPVSQEPAYPGEKLRSHDSIRLLKVHVNDHEKSTIRCTLQSFDLIDKPHYWGLSYRCGPPIKAITTTNDSLSADERQEILCNGQPFFVTQNLYEALLELSLSEFRDWLWVDAICINQGDLEERAHQVSMMERIYSTTIETVVWLGTDESGLEDLQWGIEVMLPKMLQHGPDILNSQQLTTDPKL